MTDKMTFHENDLRKIEHCARVASAFFKNDADALRIERKDRAALLSAEMVSTDNICAGLDRLIATFDDQASQAAELAERITDEIG